MKTLGKLLFVGLASMVASLAFASATMKDVETAVDVNKDYRQAETLIREVVANNPKDARDHYVYSQILHHNGKHDDAVRELAEAKRLDPAISFVKNPSRVAAYEAELNAEVHRYTPAPAPVQPRVERYTPPAAVAMPQEPIPQQKPGHTLLWVVLILAVLGVAGFFFYRRTQAHDQAEDEQRTKAVRQEQLKQANGLLETVKPFKLDIRMANPAKPELLAKVEQVEQELVGLIERLAQAPVPQAEIDSAEESLAHLHRVFEGKPDPLPSAHHVVDSNQSQYRDDDGFRPVAAAPVYQQPIYQQPMPQTVYVENNPGGMGVGGGLLTGMVLGGLMGGSHDREVIREIHEVPSQRYEDDGGNQPSDIDFGNESSSDGGGIDFGGSDDS